MSNIIDSIQLSGITYQIQGSGGGGVPESTFTAYTATTDERISQDEEVTAAGLNALNNKITPTVELTQAQYDALVDKDPNTYYIITDAQAVDLTNYYTKSETNTLLGGKQATLVSGTNIKTINNESILGSGNIDIQGGSVDVDSALSPTSENPVQNKVIYNKIDEVEQVTAAGLNALNDAVSGKQDTLVSGTNIKTINNTSILGSGNIDIQGGSTYTAGRGISIANDTISFSLPISAGTASYSIVEGNETTASGTYSHAEGKSTRASGVSSHAEGQYTTASTYAHAEGINTKANGSSSHAEGTSTTANGDQSHAEGNNTTASGYCSHSEGKNTIANNQSEHASGQYNVSSKANTAWGYSGNTLFSVGNGTGDNARHNAFEIRQNGDIYLTLDGQDVKLQDQLGGSSINVVQTTGTSTTDVMSQNAVSTKLSGYVTTDTEQTISGRKIFTYTDSSGKAIEFKQTSDSAKVGFSIKNSTSTNNEVASFEFRPNTFTIDGVKHPLVYFGHYRNKNTANAGVTQTVIGFRQYDQLNAAAYHYLLPLPEKAKTPFSLTTSFKDYYAPMGFKNGSTMITADNTGVVDLSSALGGLKLVKLTEAEYNALATKDSSTLYIIVN